MQQGTEAQLEPLQLHATRPRNDSATTVTTAASKESNRGQHSRAEQITPPLTPSASAEELAPQDVPAGGTRFHNYLRAIYPFYPPCDNFGSSITLPLNQGDLILIHSVHVNGWADGTLLASSKRGWLPTNYCEAYHPSPMSRLMDALTVFYDMILACDEAGSLEALCNQDYMRGLVAGIRYLFEVTDCLNRESPMLAPETGLAVLRRHRKSVLSELSHLVKLAKEVNACLQGSEQDVAEPDILERMLSAGFTVALRAAKFHEIWVEQQQSAPPPTPPADTVSFASQNRLSIQADQQCVDASPALSDSTFSSSFWQQEASWQSSQSGGLGPQAVQETDGLARTARPLSVRTTCQPLSHRVSWASTSNLARNGKLASTRLVSTHENFLSLLEIFSACQLIAKSPAEVLVATQGILHAGREMMTVIDAVCERGQLSVEHLDQVRNETYQKIHDFVNAATIMIQAPEHADADEFQPASTLHSYKLVDAATSCVRVAGKCVVSTRKALELIGDFEFELVDPVLLGDIDEKLSLDVVGEVEQTIIVEESSTTAECANEDSVTETHDLSLTKPPMSPSRLNRELPPDPPIHEEDDSNNPLSISTEGISGDFITSQSPMVSSLAELTPPLGTSSTASMENFTSNARNSKGSTISAASTAATSIDVTDTGMASGTYRSPLSNCEQVSADDESDDCETAVLEQSHAHELVFNSDGQVMGGSLPALVERLTTHDSTPDGSFVNTFYLTFRLFVSPEELTQALIARFENVDGNPSTAAPIQVRVYNVIKGWLESHWRQECDEPALALITGFAEGKLSQSLPAASARLLQLVDQVAKTSAPLVPRLVSSIGKAGSAQYIPADKPMPAPLLPKSQNTLLRAWKNGGAKPSMIDFEPIEVARQLTVKESKMFCAIQPEELVGCTWSKNPRVAPNVLALSSFSTDLTHLVMDTIMQPQEPNKRAKVLKHWVKICTKLLDFKNYDSLIAIMCGIDFSIIDRLKRTWDALPNKTRTSMEQLRASIDISKNYKSLRIQVAECVAPCLPFMGMYLTDLTMTKEAFPDTRALTSSGVDDSTKVINFEKHSKTAKIIAEVQRLQVPYNFLELPDLQTWLQEELLRMRFGSKETVQKHLYKRSLTIEPRESTKKLGVTSSIPVPTSATREKVDFLSLVLGKSTSAS